MSELIQTAGLDAFLEGPSFGTGINQQHLAMLVGRMQQMRKMQQMQQMGECARRSAANALHGLLA
jgi:hypothetical protein